MKIRKNTLRKGFTLVELLVVIAIIAALAALSTPAVTKALKRAALTTSINNARQVKIIMDTVAIDFAGAYPNTTVATAVTAPAVANTSSALNVLHIGGYITLPELADACYSPEVAAEIPAHTPIAVGAATLAAANSAYSYVGGLLNTSPGNTPVLTTRMVGAGVFNSNIWDHKAVVCAVNGSTTAIRLIGAIGADAGVNIPNTADDMFAAAQLPTSAVVYPN